MLTSHFRRALLALALGAGLASPAWAADPPRTYAALSLIADSLRAVGHEATTGSLLANNPRVSVPLEFDVLELPALRAVIGAVMAADSRAKVMPLKITDVATYERQGSFISGDQANLPANILDPLRQSGVTHLVLVTRHRAEARMNSGVLTLGSGTVEGVGFYIDREYTLRQLERSEVTTGYLAPFVYVRAALIDLKTLRVVSSQISTIGRVHTASGKAVGADPWEILSDVEKINVLREMIQRQVTGAVTKLLVAPA
jgi:hypothetical protein